MQYIAFYKKFNPLAIFSVNDVVKAQPGFDRKQLVYWQKKGYLQKIINRWYCFADTNLNEKELFFTANKIYAPSYVSFESALAWHGLIPESTYTITSATTIKTNNFETIRGVFAYHKIKPTLFFGYTLIDTEAGQAKMANPAKALLDFLYINPHINTKEALEEMRINKDLFKKLISKKQMTIYLEFYNSKSLERRVQLFLKLMKHA